MAINLLEEITAAEAVSRQLDPAEAERKTMTDEVVRYCSSFLTNIEHGARTYNYSDNGGEGLLQSPPCEKGTDLSSLIEMIDSCVTKQGMDSASPRYFGYIPGGGLYPSALADYLAAITNRYAGLYFACPGAVRMENMLVKWVATELGFDASSCAGFLSSGASVATLSAFVCARDVHRVLSGGPNGTTPGPKFVVYSTDQIHSCILKALWISGVTAAGVQIHYVNRTSDNALDAAHLATLVSEDVAAGLVPWLVVASAGTVNSGAIDPLEAISSIAEHHGMWFHVDGAYGGLFALCPEGKALLGGLKLAHSVVTDPHKGMFLPYGTGMLIVRDGRQLKQSHTFHAPYLDRFVDYDDPSSVDLSPELTRHFRALRMWLPLKLFGAAPFRSALTEKMLLAKYFYNTLAKNDDFEVFGPPQLSVVTYRLLPAEDLAGTAEGDYAAANQELYSRVKDEGKVFISATTIDKRFLLRMAISCFRSHLPEVVEALEVLQRHGRAIRSENSAEASR